MFCGAEHIVRRNGGVISLSPVVEAIVQVQEGVQSVRGSVEKVQTGVDKTASELALRRLKEEINELHQAAEKLEYPVQSPLLLYLLSIPTLFIGSIMFLGLLLTSLNRSNLTSDTSLVLPFCLLPIGFGLLLLRQARKVSRYIRDVDNQFDVIDKQISRRMEEIQYHERILGIPRKRTLKTTK